MLRDWCIEVVILKNISLCEEFSFLQIEAAFWIWSCDHTCRIKRVLRFLCWVFDELVTDSWYVGEEVHVALLFSEAILFLVNCYKVKLWLHCQRRLLVYVCILKSVAALTLSALRTEVLKLRVEDWPPHLLTVASYLVLSVLESHCRDHKTSYQFN